MSNFAQRSFAGGELSPALWPRTDLAKHGIGLKVCRNMIVQRSGGVANRPGTKYLGACVTASKQARIFPYVTADASSCFLEVGEGYIKIWKNESPALIDTGSVSAWSGATATYAAGSIVSRTGVYYYCRMIHDPGFSGAFDPGTGADWQKAWYAFPSTEFKFTAPYVESALAAVMAVQDEDKIVVLHPDYDPLELYPDGSWKWVCRQLNIGKSGILNYFGLTGATGTITYAVIPYDNNGNPKSPARAAAATTLTGIAVGTETIVAVTSTADFDQEGYVALSFPASGLNAGELLIPPELHLENDSVFTYLIGKAFWGQVVDATHIRLYGLDSTGMTAYVAQNYPGYGGAGFTALYKNTSTVASGGTPVSVTISCYDNDIAYYDIFRKSASSTWGFIGSIPVTGAAPTSAVFVDAGITPDLSVPPPNSLETPFVGYQGRPACGGIYQQRLVLANKTSDPTVVMTSRSSDSHNFIGVIPGDPTSPVLFKSKALKRNDIRGTLDLGQLVLFGRSAEVKVAGDAAGTLTPTDINPVAQSKFGSAAVQPVAVGTSAIFSQAGKATIRDIGFRISVNGFDGDDLTGFSRHLFDGKNVVRLAYQQEPGSVVWVARDDGKFLGMTYVKNDQLLAWHRHDTDGLVEDICSAEDVLYAIVKRTINGSVARYIEKFENRNFSDIVEACFMDSSLVYDGRNTNAASTATLTAIYTGSDWGNGSTLSMLVASATAPNIGNAYQATFIEGGELATLTIVSVIDATHYEVRPDRDILASERNVATSDWALAADTISGLSHLEGKAVSVFADAAVVASPNSPQYSSYAPVVTAGAITLPRPYGYVRVGLPYVSDIQTLGIDTVQGESLALNNKLVDEIGIYVKDTRGIWYRSNDSVPVTDVVSPEDGFYELKVRSEEMPGTPPALLTGLQRELIQTNWTKDGSVFLRQVDPIPCEIVALIPSGTFNG